MCGAANSTEDVHASPAPAQPNAADANENANAPTSPTNNEPRDENAVELSAMLAALRELRGEMKSAIDSPLMPNRQQRVLELLRDRPALAHRCGVFPEVLPSLVEANPPVAIELVLCLARDHPAPSNNLPAFFESLVSMPTSLHSMEVVNRLVSDASELLPDEFIRAYVSGCVASCSPHADGASTPTSSPGGDGMLTGGGASGGLSPSVSSGSSSGGRMVRLVCMFLQLLVRKKRLLRGTDVAAEVTQFCVENMRTKEAAALYRLLGAANEEPVGGGGGGGVVEESSGDAVRAT